MQHFGKPTELTSIRLYFNSVLLASFYICWDGVEKHNDNNCVIVPILLEGTVAINSIKLC